LAQNKPYRFIFGFTVRMQKFKRVFTFVLAAFIIVGGVNHFLKPQMYLPFVPFGLPSVAIIYASGGLEILLGVGALMLRTRKLATLGIFLLMVAFLPLHVADVFKENPAIGNHLAALIRLPIQFILIAWAWFIYKD
jgi:uncharacterized membrane protein